MIVMSIALGTAALIGSGISSASNLFSNDLAYRRQKELNRQKYEDMIQYARENGATPSAIVSGITGNAGGSVPVVSSSNNPVSDLGSTLPNAVSADASQKQAVAAENQSQAALTQAETERQLGLMRLRFEPGKYLADVRKSLAEAFEARSHGGLHDMMSKYYNELTKDVVQVRPWKIAGLRQSLLNDMATYNKIVQDTRTSKAQQGFYESGSRLNDANASKAWSESLNESLRGFRLQFENSLLAAGIDPSRPFFDNTLRLMSTDPNLFRQRMDLFVSSLNLVDNRLQRNLGEHYKRNAAIGFGFYKLNQIHQKNANDRAYRFGTIGRAISSFIPFTNGSVPAPAVGQSGPGVDWWLKD